MTQAYLPSDQAKMEDLVVQGAVGSLLKEPESLPGLRGDINGRLRSKRWHRSGRGFSHPAPVTGNVTVSGAPWKPPPRRSATP